jgi:hypothetical protein
MPDVGAPDPEHSTSPIIDESSWDEEGAPLYPDTDADGVCLYNDAQYKVGEYVWAGDEVLRCERGGVWVRMDSELE